MLAQPHQGDGAAVSQMTRQQLIEALLESNEHSSFEFTRQWLSRQWTFRLRALLRHRLQHRASALDAS